MKIDAGMVRIIKNHKETTEKSTLRCSDNLGTVRVAGYNRSTLTKHNGITIRSSSKPKRITLSNGKMTLETEQSFTSQETKVSASPLRQTLTQELFL